MNEVASLAPAAMPAKVEDRQSTSRAEALRARLLEEARRFAGRGFTLAREGPLRVAAIGIGAEDCPGDCPGDCLVVVVLHHIAGDGWSVAILARELAALYRGHGGGSAAALPALALQYADYAAWQRAWLASGVEARELGYWRGGRRVCCGCPGRGRVRRCRGIAAGRLRFALARRRWRGWRGCAGARG